MKKFTILFFAVLLTSSVIAMPDRKRAITREELPAPAIKFLQKHFPNVPTIYVQKDMEVGDMDYELMLEDGTKVEFNRKGQLKKVENPNGVSLDILSKNIADVLSKRFSKQSVVEIDYDRRTIEVEMSNGVEIKFDRDGRIISFD